MFRFKDTVKLWRLPASRSGGTVLNECKTTGITMYNIVCGTITTIASEKHGVPYVGGARYTIVWEDGLVEEAVSATELLKVYVNTPQSLGCGTRLDEHLVENLLKLGIAAGELLEVQRTRDVVITLRKQIFQPELQDTDVCEITLDAIGNVITGIRVSHLLAFNPTKNEAVSLMIKFPSARTVDRALKNTFSNIVRECMQSPNPTVPSAIDDNHGLEWVVVEIPVPAGYSWPRESMLTRFFCAFIRYKNPQQAAGLAEIRYFVEMVTALSEALSVLFQKLLRAKHRKDLIKSIEEQLYEWRHLPVSQICHNALQVACEVLPAPTAMYVGVLKPGGNELHFIASNASSEMTGKVLRRGLGISFDTMEHGDPVVLRDTDVDKRKVLVPNAIVDVMYGRVYYRAKILVGRGHDMYDIIYEEDQQTETAVNIDRIRPVNSAFRTHRFGHIELPFVSVPLRYRTKAVGVLNVDNFRNVPRAPYDPQPEEGIVNFLDKLGRILGTTLDTQSKKASLKAFATVCRSPISTLNEIMETLFEVLNLNLFFVSSIVACQVPTEDPNNPGDSKKKSGGGSGGKSSAISKNKETAKLAKGGVQVTDNKGVKIAGGKIVVGNVRKTVNIILAQGNVPPEVKSSLNSYDPEKYHLKPVQPKGEKSIWLVCKLRSPDETIPAKIFLVAIGQRQPFNDPDVEYLQVIQKILVEGLQGLDVRKARGEIRFEALREIKQICLRWPTMDRHDLFGAVMEQVEMCFFSANMYVGKIGMFNQEIRFFLASRLSNMKGQVLKRLMKDGVSFTAVDEMKRIFIHQKSALNHSLHHFGPREQFEYPFVVIPIVAHIDAAIAVLAVDSCDDPISDSERHENIISFFGTVAAQLSTAIKGYCAQDARAELARIAHTAKTFREGIREVKRCLLTYLPFATRVSEIIYLPKELTSFRGDLVAQTLDDYIVHIRVIQLESLCKQLPATSLECYWNGVSVFKTKFKIDADCLPFSIRVSKGIPLSHVNLQCVVRGANGKDLCRKTLGFHYFVNTPVYAIDHVFDNVSSNNFRDVHIAKVTLVSKMYRYDESVFFTITNIQGIELSKVNDRELPDPVARIYWNGTELARTPALEKTKNPVWEDQQIIVSLDSKISGTGVLAVELWDEDVLGRSTFFGRVEVAETKLNDMAVSVDAHREAGFHSEKLSANAVTTTNAAAPGEQRKTRVFGSEKTAPAGQLTSSGPSSSSLAGGGLATAGSFRDPRKSVVTKAKRTTFVESIHEVVEHPDEGMVWLALGKHPTLPAYMQNLVGGSMSLKGYIVKAFEMNTKQVMDSLNVSIVDTVSTTILDTESGGQQSHQAEFFSSELKVLSARHLVLKETYSSIPEPIINPFALISFNGEEVGRTGTILRSDSPLWDDEKFTIRIPAKDPGASILHIEVFHLGDHGKAILIGRVTITGSQLVSLLAGSLMRCWWFDLHPREGQSLEQSFFRGQIKLAGHPWKIDITGQEVDTSQPRNFEISVLAGKHLLTKENKLNRYVITVTFNGVMILTSQAYTETGEVKWNNERVAFWQTGNIPLEKSELLIEFWPLDKTGARVVDKRLAVVHVTGVNLRNLFTHEGCVSSWLPVIHISDATNATIAAVSGKKGLKSTHTTATPGECLIRTGPHGAQDEILTDGREMFVHIMAASMLTARHGTNKQQQQGSTQSMIKCNPYCVVKWNDRIIGRTKVMNNSIDPIWSKQRFCFRAPRDHGDDDIFANCSLRIDVYDRSVINEELIQMHNTAAHHSPRAASSDAGTEESALSAMHQPDKCIGTVLLTGKGLSLFLNSGVIRTRWIPLIKENVSAYQEKMDRASATSQRAIYGEIKLRGGAMGDADDHTNEAIHTSEFRLDIVSATGLSQADAFHKSNPYAIVEWGKKERGRTKICMNTNAPEFFQESLILRVPTDKRLKDMTLTVSLWSFKERYQDDFLGCVVFANEDLVKFLNQPATRSQQHPLGKSPDLTEEENTLAQGTITLRGSLVEPEVKMSNIYRDALLTIHSAKDLAKCNVFGNCIDCYCVIYWSSMIENGGLERELHRTQVVTNTLDPQFQDENVIVNVPLEADWTMVTVRVEVWDIGNDFLGCVILCGEDLKEVLGRSGKDTVKPVMFHLGEHPALPKNRQSLVQGRLLLCGGDRDDTEQQLALLAAALSEEENARNTYSVKGFDENGPPGTITISGCKKLGKGDALLGKSNPFCKVRWNKKALPNTETIYSTLNPHWEHANYEVKLPAENNLERCLLEIEVWHANALGSDVAEFLGMVSLRGAMLGAVFSSQGKKEVEFALKENPVMNAKQNKLVSSTASISLSGFIDESAATNGTGGGGVDADATHLERIQFEINVMAASDLANTNAFGRPPDSFVAIYWKDQDKPAAKTLVVAGKANPTFAETFIFEKPEGVGLNTYCLRLAMFSKNTVKENDFLGEVVFKGDTLEDWICHNDGRLTTFDLEKNPVLAEKKQTFVKGSITIGTRSLSDASQSQEKVVPPGMKEMEVSVLAASNLPRANMFGGQSDPYCVLYWGAAEIGKTSTIKETCDPVWDGDESFQFFAPTELGVVQETAKFGAKDAKAADRESMLATAKSIRRTLLSSAKGRDDELRLIVEVFDWNRVGRGVFLGSLELSGQELHDFAAGDRAKRQWFSLGRSKIIPPDLQKLVKPDSNAKIELMLGPFEESMDAREIELTVVEASGLAKVDTFGFADPYVKIRFNNKFVGKTDVVKRTLNPTWDKEVFELRLPSNVEFRDSVLYLEVWDWNLTAKGTFLGSVQLAGHDLQRFVEESHLQVTWFELTKSEYLPEGMQGYVQGKIALKAGFIGAHEQVQMAKLQKYDIGVLSASNLVAKHEGIFGSASSGVDSYVIVKYQGKEIGRTSHIAKTFNPAWDDQVFALLLDVTSASATPQELSFEVWTYALLSRGECLGTVVISGPQFDELFGLGGENGDSHVSKKRGKSHKVGGNGDDDEEESSRFVRTLELKGVSSGARAGPLSGSPEPAHAAAPEPALSPSRSAMSPTRGAVINKSAITAAVASKQLASPNRTFSPKRSSSPSKQQSDTSKSTQQPPEQPKPQQLTVSISRILADHEVTADGPKIDITWSEERDTDAGNPVLELTILKAEDLITAKSILNTTDPYCVVLWNGTEIGTTAVSKGNNPSWNHEKFALRLDPTVEANNGSMVIELWDSETLRKGTFLGQIVVPFWSIIRLSDGLFTFALECSAKGQLVRGALTIAMRIKFAYWDSIVPHVPLISRRKVQVLSGNEFPKISNEFPNTKCIISYNEVIKLKTIVAENETNPVWPIAQCEILVDANVPTDMHLQVFHVDNVEQKEICIGEVEIPFEYLLRPPSESFDVFLGPPAKLPPRKYRFAVSGSVHIQVINTQTLRVDEHQCYSASTDRHLASVGVEDCLANRKQELNSEDMQLDGARLTEDQLLWLGSAYDVTGTQALYPQKQWIVVPIRDLGIRSGARFHDFYGTTPGHRFALAIQRPRDKMNISDAYLLGDIEESLQNCVMELRRKQVFQDLRAHVLMKYKHALTEIMKQDIFSNEVVYRWLIKAMKMTFPGCTLNLAILSKDQSTLNVQVFEKYVAVAGDGANAAAADKVENTNWYHAKPALEFAMIRGQGFDWELVGRHPPRSVLLRSINDLFVNSASASMSRHLFSCKPFANSRLPKIYIPFLAGDVASSYFSIEDIDLYKGGMHGAFTDEEDVRGWLEEIGSVFGDAMYVGKEKLSLRVIERFSHLWDCTVPALLHQILTQCLYVLQACRLMEVWSMAASTQNLKSLVGKVADPPLHGGRLLIVRSVNIKPLKSQVNAARDFDDSQDGGFSEDASSVASQDEAMDNEFSPFLNTPVKRHSRSQNANTVRWFCGIRYDGFEDCQLLDSTTPGAATPGAADGKKALPNQSHTKQQLQRLSVVSPHPGQSPFVDMSALQFTTKEVRVRITNDRNLIISLYAVDKNLNVLQEYTGRATFQTLQENSLKTVLTSLRKETSNSATSPAAQSPFTPVVQGFEAELSLLWPRPETAIPKVDVKSLEKKLRSITVTVSRANGLITIPNSKTGPNAYCEVYYGKKLIGKTAVVKDNNFPSWGQTFTVQYKKNPAPIAVEVYDFTMLGKGACYGRIEVPFEQIIMSHTSTTGKNSVVGETDFPLSHKLGVKASKQKYIGGMLTIEYSAELIDAVNVDEEESKHTKHAKKDQRATTTNALAPVVTAIPGSNSIIPRALFSMENPALSLTIACATDLPKANMFGGGSDPYVLIFTSTGGKDPIHRSQVVENNLDPIWNETFVVNFGVSLTPETTTVRDFPDIILEVWDYNRTNAGSFLGCVTISPHKYLTTRSGDFVLTKSAKKTDKENRLVNGTSTISLRMRIQDNVSNISTQKYHFSHLHKCLNTLAYVEVYILRCKDLMITNRYTGKSNPYVKVMWNDRVFQTPHVKNNLNPVWNNEKFSINISSMCSLGEELVVQVWEKNFFADGVFMGEIRIPAEQLLHPKLFNQEHQLKPMQAGHGHTQAEANALNSKDIKGSIVIRLVQKYHHQRLELQPAYVDPAAIKGRKQGSQQNEQFDIVDLAVARDPDEEKKRQQFEKSKFPTLVATAKEQTKRYIDHPFDRTVGLISEVHYGQVVSAVARTEQTVLRTDKADICCVPTEFVGADDSAKNAGNNSSSGTRTSLFHKATEDAAHANKSEAMMLVAKYETSRLPRRDITFLTRVSSLLNSGLQLAHQRATRVATRSQLVHKITELQDHVKDSPEEFCLDTISLVEAHLHCPIDLFMIGIDGKNLFKCDRITGKIDYLNTANSNASITNVFSAITSDFLKVASKLCRHSILLQYYRGKLSVLDMKWDSLSQLCAIPFSSNPAAAAVSDQAASHGKRNPKSLGQDAYSKVVAEIELVEDEGICSLLTELCPRAEGEGCYVLPIIANNELCIGMMLIQEINKIPSAVYTIKNTPENDHATGKDGKQKKKPAASTAAHSRSSAGEHNDQVDFTAPEHGVTDTLREVSSLVGSGIVHCRMIRALNEMSDFSSNITFETPLMDIVRYWFRQIAIALPTVREITIWGVDLFQDPNEQLYHVQQRLNAQQGAGANNNNKLLDRFKFFNNPVFGFVMSMFSRNPKKSKEVSEVVHSLEQQLNTDAYNKQPPIVAGFFAEEDPSEMLTTPIERKKFASTKGVEKDSGPNTSGRYRRNAIQVARIHKHIVQHAMETVETMKKDWTVQAPSVFYAANAAPISSKGDNASGSPSPGGAGAETPSPAKSLGSSSLGMGGGGASLASGMTGGDGSAITTLHNIFGLKSPKETTPAINRNYLELVRKETIRCTQELKKNSFRVASGHFLCSIANDDSSKAALDDIFDPDYAKRKAEYERDRQLMLLKKYELEGKRRQRMRERRRKQMLQQQAAQQQAQQVQQQTQLQAHAQSQLRLLSVDEGGSQASSMAKSSSRQNTTENKPATVASHSTKSNSPTKSQKVSTPTPPKDDNDNMSDISDDEDMNLDDLDDDDELLSDEEDGNMGSARMMLMKSISFHKSPHQHSLKFMAKQASQHGSMSRSPSSHNQALMMSSARNYSFGNAAGASLSRDNSALISSSRQVSMKKSPSSMKMIAGTSNAASFKNFKSMSSVSNINTGSPDANPDLANAANRMSARSSSQLVSSQSKRPFFQAPLPPTPPPPPATAPPNSLDSGRNSSARENSMTHSLTKQASWLMKSSSKFSSSFSGSPNPFASNGRSGSGEAGSNDMPSPGIFSTNADLSGAAVDTNSLPPTDPMNPQRRVKRLAFRENATSHGANDNNSGSVPLNDGNESLSLLSGVGSSSIVSARSLNLDDPAHRGLGWKYFVSVYHQGSFLSVKQMSRILMFIFCYLYRIWQGHRLGRERNNAE
jgi:Ca2+-dependent lipid-binding protein